MAQGDVAQGQQREALELTGEADPVRDELRLRREHKGEQQKGGEQAGRCGAKRARRGVGRLCLLDREDSEQRQGGVQVDQRVIVGDRGSTMAATVRLST